LLLRELHEAEAGDKANVDTVLHQPRAADYQPKPLEYHHRAPNFGLALGRAATVMNDLLLSGLFDAYPRLRVGLIETWVGWIPRALEALDDIWRRNRHVRRIPLENPPSHYWTSNMMASFLDDRLGIAARHMIGVDKIMWSSDYPHFGTFWPRSREVAKASIGTIPAEEQALILSGNCIDFYKIGDRIRL
jgi:predicted TIM-barrel fold metal-dependent hydrolase